MALSTSQIRVCSSANSHYFFLIVLSLHLSHEVAADINIINLHRRLLPFRAGSCPLLHLISFRPSTAIGSREGLSAWHELRLLRCVTWATVLA